jgi:hypothetical protein
VELLPWTAFGPSPCWWSHEQQLEITREIGDRRSEGTALGRLGTTWAALGEPQRAIEFSEQRLVIARAIGDRMGEAIGL